MNKIILQYASCYRNDAEKLAGSLIFFVAGIMNNVQQYKVTVYVHGKKIVQVTADRMPVMKDIKLPGPESRVVVFGCSVFKLKYKLRSACLP